MARRWSTTVKSMILTRSFPVLVSSDREDDLSSQLIGTDVSSHRNRSFHGPDGLQYTWSIAGVTSKVSRARLFGLEKLTRFIFVNS